MRIFAASPPLFLPSLILFPNMVQELLEMRRSGESAKFRPAIVANSHGCDTPVHQPVKKSKERQTKPVRKRNQGYPQKHHQASYDAVKILLDVKLPAPAQGAVFKKRFSNRYGPCCPTGCAGDFSIAG